MKFIYFNELFKVGGENVNENGFVGVSYSWGDV